MPTERERRKAVPFSFLLSSSLPSIHYVKYVYTHLFILLVDEEEKNRKISINVFHYWRPNFVYSGWRREPQRRSWSQTGGKYLSPPSVPFSLLHFDQPSSFNIRYSPLHLFHSLTPAPSSSLAAGELIEHTHKKDKCTTHAFTSRAPLSLPHCLSRFVHSLWSTITWYILD